MISDEQKQELIEAGFTGEANYEDWMKLQSTRGTEVFGSIDNQQADALKYTGNTELFYQWFKTYTK